MSECGIDLDNGAKTCKKGVTKYSKYCIKNEKNNCVFANKPNSKKQYTLKEILDLEKSRVVADIPSSMVSKEEVSINVADKLADSSLDNLSEDFSHMINLVEPSDISINYKPSVKLRVLPTLNKVLTEDIRVYNLEDDFVDMISMGREGTFGEAYSAKIKDNNVDVVLKKYKDYNLSKIIDYSIINEISLLRHLNKYPDTKTVKLYGLALSNDKNHLYLVLEWLETDFHKLIMKEKNKQKDDGRLSGQMYKIILYKFLSALDAFHRLGVVHNDFKLSNVMLMRDDIKIIDLGLSQFIGYNPSIDIIYTYNTTLSIKAPDVKTEHNFIPGNRMSYVSDSFSVGASIIHLMLRSYCYISYDIITNRILLNGNDNISGYILGKLGDLGFDLLKNLIHPNTKLRYTCGQALNHPYFKDITGSVVIDRTLIGGSYVYNILLRQYISYTEEEYMNNQFEVAYLEDIHNNYIDDILPYVPLLSSDNINMSMRKILLDWIYSLFIIRYNLDTLLNSVNLLDIYTNKKIENHSENGVFYELYGQSVIYIYTCMFNLPYEINIIKAYSDDAYTEQQIKDNINNILQTINFKLDFKPIYIHIMYIYYKLKYETDHNILDNNNKSYDLAPLYEHLLNSMIGIIILYYLYLVKPDRSFKDLPIHNVAQYSAIRSLSKILNIDIKLFLNKPLIPCLELSIDKYDIINNYFNKSINYVKSLETGIFFTKLSDL